MTKKIRGHSRLRFETNEMERPSSGLATGFH